MKKFFPVTNVWTSTLTTSPTSAAWKNLEELLGHPGIPKETPCFCLHGNLATSGTAGERLEHATWGADRYIDTWSKEKIEGLAKKSLRLHWLPCRSRQFFDVLCFLFKIWIRVMYYTQDSSVPHDIAIFLGGGQTANQESLRPRAHFSRIPRHGPFKSARWDFLEILLYNSGTNVIPEVR